jgi:hypothetical protein
MPFSVDQSIQVKIQIIGVFLSLNDRGVDEIFKMFVAQSEGTLWLFCPEYLL